MSSPACCRTAFPNFIRGVLDCPAVIRAAETFLIRAQYSTKKGTEVAVQEPRAAMQSDALNFFVVAPDSFTAAGVYSIEQPGSALAAKRKSLWVSNQDTTMHELLRPGLTSP